MDILRLSILAGKLKRLPRTGWVNHQVKDPESVAEHCFRVAFLAMFLAPKLGLDQIKAVKMGLIHDLAEAEIGDVVTRIGEKTLPNLTDKVKEERSAMAEISKLVETENLLALFDEYEANNSPEAQLIKQIDKLEMAIQAHEYELEQEVDLEEFFVTTRMDVTTPELKEILGEIEDLRRKK